MENKIKRVKDDMEFELRVFERTLAIYAEEESELCERYINTGDRFTWDRLQHAQTSINWLRHIILKFNSLLDKLED